jgi:hypothetical protein
MLSVTREISSAKIAPPRINDAYRITFDANWELALK